MRKLILFAVSSVAIGAAHAADLPTYYSPIATYDPAPVMSAGAAGFNWDSYFVGASGLIGATDPFAFGADAFVGVTATANDFLYGGVLSVGVLSTEDDPSFHIEMASRFGILLTDEVAAFATIGGGYETEYDDSYVLVGGGVSVAVADNISVEATLKGNHLNGAPDGDEWRLVGGLGLAFHF